MDLLTVALLLGAGKLFKGKKTADRLEYFPKNVYFSKTDKKFYLIMEILNPTKNSLKIDSFFGGVFVGTTKVGSIEKGTPFTLEANKRTEVKYPIIPVGTGLGTIAVQIIQAILKGKGKDIDISFKIIGVARALGIDNPVNETLSLSM